MKAYLLCSGRGCRAVPFSPAGHSNSTGAGGRGGCFCSFLASGVLSSFRAPPTCLYDPIIKTVMISCLSSGPSCTCCPEHKRGLLSLCLRRRFQTMTRSLAAMSSISFSRVSPGKLLTYTSQTVKCPRGRRGSITFLCIHKENKNVSKNLSNFYP